MSTKPNIAKVERVDDIPLLLAQMEKMGVAPLIDKHFPTHGNWQGLSLGQVVIVWLAYILSAGDHRMNIVQSWAAGLLITLKSCLGLPKIRELDFSDDRLSTVLDYLGKNDSLWESYEIEQSEVLLRVYDLKAKRVRIDSTTVKSYTSIEEEGLFQFGHSKDHRSDLPQLKINQAVLDPLGLPLSTTIVSGESADDPLYVPEIRKVQSQLKRDGVLYIGDCKMAAFDTRAYIEKSNDYYLCPLSAVQVPRTELELLLIPVWKKTQELTPVYQTEQDVSGDKIHIANGFSYEITIRLDEIEWKEKRLVVQSLKHAKSKQDALDKRLKKAEQEIENLNRRGRGCRHLNDEEARVAVESILKRYKVNDLLAIKYDVKTKTTHTRAYRGRSKKLTMVTVTVSTTRNIEAYNNAVRVLGWRVFVCNDFELSLEEVVLAYRAQYIVERGFGRYKGKTLNLTPLFIGSNLRIKGLIRLLSIGLRVLSLVEFTVRESLHDENEKLNGIYPGNPKRSTSKPTTEMILKVFVGINMVIYDFGGSICCNITPLNAVQSRILNLLGLKLNVYQELKEQLGQIAFEVNEQ